MIIIHQHIEVYWRYPQKPSFNYFREEDTFDLSTILSPFDDTEENVILKDTNLVGIKTLTFDQ
jgi:hypothetical protein